MLYNLVENDWGEVTVVPTTLGNSLLAVLLVAVMAAAIIFAQRSNGKKSSAISAKQLAFCALAIALGTVLSEIKVFHFPTGGSITLFSMLIICLPGYWFGTGAGILTGVAYGLLQLIIDPYVLYPSQLVVDYILAFGALGLSGVFRKNKYGLQLGYVAAIIGRYIFAVISGWIFFGDYAWEGWGALPYSLAYNAIYIFAEAAITLVILFVPAVSKAIKRVGTEVNKDVVEKEKRASWELKDIIMMAILGVIFAAVYLGIFEAGLALSTALTPWGLSNYAFEVIYGVWFMASTLAAYIIRKPGVALVCEVLASVVELLMGNSGGITVVLTGLIQGAGAELVFAAFRYKKWNIPSMSLAGITSALFIFVYELFYLDYIHLAPLMLVCQLAVRFVSAIVFSGIICKLLGDGLAKTGVVKSYAIGANANVGKVYDEEE